MLEGKEIEKEFKQFDGSKMSLYFCPQWDDGVGQELKSVFSLCSPAGLSARLEVQGDTPSSSLPPGATPMPEMGNRHFQPNKMVSFLYSELASVFQFLMLKP